MAAAIAPASPPRQAQGDDEVQGVSPRSGAGASLGVKRSAAAQLRAVQSGEVILGKRPKKQKKHD